MEITWQLIAGICGGFVLLCTAGEKTYHIFKPVGNWKKKVDDMQTELNEVRSYTERDYKDLQHINEVVKGIAKSVVSQQNHMIDGNHVEAMKKTRDELIDLISKM